MTRSLQIVQRQIVWLLGAAVLAALLPASAFFLYERLLQNEAARSVAFHLASAEAVEEAMLKLDDFALAVSSAPAHSSSTLAPERRKRLFLNELNQRVAFLSKLQETNGWLESKSLTHRLPVQTAALEALAPADLSYSPQFHDLRLTLDQLRLLHQAAHAGLDARLTERRQALLLLIVPLALLIAGAGGLVFMMAWRSVGRALSAEEKLHAAIQQQVIDIQISNEQLRKEIEERKRIERRERHRTLVLERLTSGASLPEILEFTANSLAADDPTALTSILLLDESGRRLVYGVRPRLPDYFNQSILGLEIGPAVGACGAAAFLGERVVIEDIFTHPNGAAFRDLARRADVRSVWSQPVFSSDRKVLGTFAVYHREARAPQPHEIETIEAAAGFVSLAIERKRAEAAMEELQAQLLHSQKMEAVGQLAGGVAHDFNNILSATVMQLDLLQRDHHLDPSVHKALAELQDYANRAANLTRQLLLFSRRQIMQPKEVELNALLSNLVRMLRRLIGEHISLELNGATEEMWLEADPGMIEQVVVNLVVNGRDAMPQGGRLSLAADPREVTAEDVARNQEARVGRFICLSVHDSGSGMDEATLDRIFEPFFTTKETGQGTGLGLATVYGVVQQHLGWIEVETTVGRGSSFQVYLPALPSPKAALAITPEPSPAKTGNEMLLLVEDESSVREVMVRILTAQGYEVLEAASGPEALALAPTARRPIQLLITDMVMPGGMTGLDLAERLRLATPNLKTIIASGYNVEWLNGAIADPQWVTYLPKPFRMPVLAEIVRNVLDAAP